MSADRKPEQGRNPEQGSPNPPPTERGSERFPWKSLLLTLGLTAAGVAIGSLIFNPFNLSETVGLRALATGAVAGIGFGTGIILTGGFNIFRENVVSLWGHGELHPKSPSLLRIG